jgi:HSP20 family protein
MNLIRWNPAFDLLNVHSEMDRVFNELIGGTGFNPRYNGGSTAPAYLPVDIRREGDDVIVEASVPGFRPEEVNVTVDAGVMTISASHEEEREEKEGEYLRRERYIGQVYRQIDLGDQVDGERAEAAFKDGVLSVRIPLLSKPEPKRIPVHGESRSENGKANGRATANAASSARETVGTATPGGEQK